MKGTNKSDRQVKCPTCGTPTLFSAANEFRPFCCDRCKTGDLAAWASETYAVPVSGSSEDNEENLAADVTELD